MLAIESRRQSVCVAATGDFISPPGVIKTICVSNLYRIPKWLSAIFQWWNVDKLENVLQPQLWHVDDAN